MRRSTHSIDPATRAGILLQLAMLAAAAVLVACSTSLEVRTNIDRIEVMPVSSTITTGEMTEVTATAFDKDGEELVAAFDWSSDGGLIRVLDRNRIEFQGVEPGLTTITASIGFQAGSATIDVVEGDAGG